MQPTSEQSAAIDLMEQFLRQSSEQFFVLEGPAGTGKTFCMIELTARVKGRLVFTAPTNKATKVLRDMLTTPDYKPECRTIYSLLGLRMEANGEVKELAMPEDPIDLTKFLAIVIDEGSMVNTPLMSYLTAEVKAQGLNVIIMGDRAQLPPVGEQESPVWRIEHGARLRTIMRFDNQILALSKTVREAQNSFVPRVKLPSNNSGGEGVWNCASPEFIARIVAEAGKGTFSKPNTSKAIAWRNVRVDELNALIRQTIFDNAQERFWLPTDRITLLGQAKGDGPDQRPLATTDDEGTVETVSISYHPIYTEMKVWNLGVRLDDNSFVTLRALHKDSQGLFAREKGRRADAAKAAPRKWKLFWEFVEQFHEVRHAYATTAHRAQGSTYERAFVDYKDILRNLNRREAFQCLYVAVTRPKKELYLA